MNTYTLVLKSFYSEVIIATLSDIYCTKAPCPPIDSRDEIELSRLVLGGGETIVSLRSTDELHTTAIQYSGC